jgi:hypothetical protein
VLLRIATSLIAAIHLVGGDSDNLSVARDRGKFAGIAYPLFLSLFPTFPRISQQLIGCRTSSRQLTRAKRSWHETFRRNVATANWFQYYTRLLQSQIAPSWAALTQSAYARRLLTVTRGGPGEEGEAYATRIGLRVFKQVE